MIRSNVSNMCWCWCWLKCFTSHFKVKNTVYRILYSSISSALQTLHYPITNGHKKTPMMRLFPRFMQHLFGDFGNPCFVVKRKKEHLYSAQGPNQSHLTPLFFRVFSCESVQHVCECARANQRMWVWGESECGREWVCNRLLLVLIIAVTQITAFMGSKRAAMENSGPV